MGYTRGIMQRGAKIEKGTVNDTPIGATTPSTGVFSGLSLSVTSVAAAGNDNTNAAALGAGINIVSGADGTKGVILPAAVAGKVVIVKGTANAILKVYPASGDGINELTVTTGALSMAAKTSAIFVAADATTWYTIPLLPS